MRSSCRSKTLVTSDVACVARRLQSQIHETIGRQRSITFKAKGRIQKTRGLLQCRTEVCLSSSLDQKRRITDESFVPQRVHPFFVDCFTQCAEKQIRPALELHGKT